MSSAPRQTASAFGILALSLLLIGVGVGEALSLQAARAQADALTEQSQALQAREKKAQARPGRDLGQPRAFQAATVTLAGAALQGRLEAAVAAAKGRLLSSKLDVDSHEAERRIAISAELTIAEPDMQALLFDIETGRPYLFIEAFDARAPETPGENGVMRVSLNLSAQWSATP